MMLVYSGTTTVWRGERIDGILHQPNIEALWTDADLAAIGLERYDTPPLPPPEPAAHDVKREAQRRIMALVGVADMQSCLIKQLNATMRAIELTNKRASGFTLTEGEESEALALQALANSIKAIRAKSDVIEALAPIPADYADNSRWA